MQLRGVQGTQHRSLKYPPSVDPENAVRRQSCGHGLSACRCVGLCTSSLADGVFVCVSDFLVLFSLSICLLFIYSILSLTVKIWCVKVFFSICFYMYVNWTALSAYVIFLSLVHLLNFCVFNYRTNRYFKVYTKMFRFMCKLFFRNDTYSKTLKIFLHVLSDQL